MAFQIELEKVANVYVGDRAWSVDLVLRVGAELAQAVNKYPSLTGQGKSELVCQIILKLLEDAEKVEKGLMQESTETKNTKVPWEECKMVVRTLLPATLELIVSAARGKFDLQKTQQLAVGCLPFLIGLFAAKEKPVQLTLRSPPKSTPNQSNVVTEPLKESVSQEAKEVAHESPLALSDEK
jgi:hypothetical protein